MTVLEDKSKSLIEEFIEGKSHFTLIDIEKDLEGKER